MTFIKDLWCNLWVTCNTQRHPAQEGGVVLGGEIFGQNGQSIPYSRIYPSMPERYSTAVEITTSAKPGLQLTTIFNDKGFSNAKISYNVGSHNTFSNSSTTKIIENGNQVSSFQTPVGEVPVLNSSALLEFPERFLIPFFELTAFLLPVGVILSLIAVLLKDYSPPNSNACYGVPRPSGLATKHDRIFSLSFLKPIFLMDACFIDKIRVKHPTVSSINIFTDFETFRRSLDIRLTQISLYGWSTIYYFVAYQISGYYVLKTVWPHVPSYFANKFVLSLLVICLAGGVTNVAAKFVSNGCFIGFWVVVLILTRIINGITYIIKIVLNFKNVLN